jgi:hypothetical protein
MKREKRKYVSLGIILICMFTCLPDIRSDNERYENRKIEEIMELMEKNHLDVKAAGEYSLGSACPGKNLILGTDSKGAINHVGIKLFDRRIIADYPSPVYLFVERYLLWALLMKDESAIKERLKEDRVVFRFGMKLNDKIYPNLKQSLREIKQDQSFIITTDNSKYAVTWLEDHRPILSISFPIQYELIWGMNKKEAESLFQEDLKVFLSKERALPAEAAPTELSLVRDSCYRSEGDFYGLEDITSYRYYTKRAENQAYLIYNRANPVESVANLFTANPDSKIKIEITQRMYGGKRELFTASLTDFLSFCRENGCEIFVGIERQEEYSVAGTAIMVNRSLGYNHILYFNVDMRMWDNPESYPVTAQLYAFVPMHNVSSLYGDSSKK